MGTIKCGFWTTKFLVTPDEFGEFVRICIDNCLIDTTEKEAMNGYKANYERIVSEKKLAYKPPFELYIGLEGKCGFPLILHGLQFWLNKKFYDIPHMNYQLSYQKGYPVTDETGKHFIYEDINSHFPELYPMYESLSNYIKSITKPFKITVEKEELKYPIRISQQAASDLENSWFYTENNIKIQTYKKKNKK